MSGVKNVTLTTTQHNQLVNDMRNAQATAAEVKQREQRAQAALNAANNRVENLTRKLDSANSQMIGLNNELRQVTEEQNQRLIQQARNTNASIEELRIQMRQDRQALQNAINTAHVNLEARERSHQKIAESWVKGTQSIFSEIKGYRHELFTPGELQALTIKLNQALVDIKTGSYQSLISTARAIYNQAVELKDEVVNEENIWNRQYDAFQQALADAKSNLNECQNRRFDFDTEEGTEIIDANIDYWTDGSLSREESNLTKIEHRAEKIEGMTAAEVLAMQKEIEIICQMLEILEGNAKDAIVASQLRAEMGAALRDAFDEIGYECVGVTYESNEPSEPLHIKLNDGMGNEIVAIISPRGKDNNLELNFYDPDNYDDDKHDRWINSIRSNLSDNGFMIGVPQCKPGTEGSASENIELLDIQATRAKPSRRAVEQELL